jgi:2-succinyl-5-enolpyruvyl-6-hydroxy-3-cyclohexene-1-carboxylate synthase
MKAPAWPNVNAMWADVLVDELARCGVRHAVLSPGSRSAPLALAAKRRIPNVHVVVDERSAAYFALGISRMGGAWPVLLVTTSGTAVANLHAALVEADHSGAPLVAITADRPHELRDVGANQAIQQPGIFGATVRWSCDLMLPEATAAGLRHVRQRACRAVGLARLRQGPVHLNVPLREPLAPVPNGAVGTDLPRELLVGRTDKAGKPVPWTRVATPERGADTWTVERWADVLASPRGVVVCGPSVGGASMAKDAESFCQALGLPLLLDPLAGSHPVAPRPPAVALPDLVLANPRARAALRPDWILQLGAAPTSKHVRAYLEGNPGTPRLIVDPLGKAWDELEAGHEVLHADSHQLLPALAKAARKRKGAAAAAAAAADASWLSRFDALASAVLRARPTESDWEGPVAQLLLDHLASAPALARTEPRLLWAGSSLPVRDLDRHGAFAEPHGPLRILANRGASGIDGVLSAAAGAASTTKGRCLAYVGDLTFLHDLSGLAAVKRYAPHLTLVVLNNQGGRIFEHLPIADAIPRADFEELFATPQDVDIGKACEAFGIRHARLQGTAKLAAALGKGAGGVIEVMVDPKVAVQRRKEHLAKAVAAADAVVSSWQAKPTKAGRPRKATKVDA